MDCRKKENGYVIMSAINSDYVIDLSGAVISEGKKYSFTKVMIVKHKDGI